MNNSTISAAHVRRNRTARGFALSLAGALLATLMLAGSTVAAPGGPWQQQSTTCLVGPHLVAGHVYWHSGTGKTGCWRD